MTRDITDIRNEISERIVAARIPGRAVVLLGPTDYTNPGEVMLVVRIIVGPTSPGNEVTVDKLFHDLPAALETNGDVFVARCSGHRLYADSPDEAPQIGAEWNVKVLT